MYIKKARRDAARYCKRTWRLVWPYRSTYPGCSPKGEKPKRDGNFFIHMMRKDVKAFYKHRVNCYFEEWMLSC